MSKEIILLKDVEHLGKAGDIVTVADGYARNYLLPKELGDVVSESTKRKLAKIQKENAIARQTEIAEASKLLSAIENVQCTIAVKVTEEDKMYGSVTEDDIIAALAEQDVELPKKALVMEEHIKELGVYDINVNLDPEVSGTLKVWVVNEES